MTVADITIVPVRLSQKDDYVAFSRQMAEVYRDHGATRVVDYWQTTTAADQKDFHADKTPHDPGALRGIAEIAGTAPREAVVVTVTEWPSREVRDRGTSSATRDPRVRATLDQDPIFDGRRLVGESFEVIMDLRDAH